MFTTSANFHPMLGHVSEGCSILFANGETLTVKSTLLGWCLVDWKGEQVSPSDMSANALVAFIFQRDCA